MFCAKNTVSPRLRLRAVKGSLNNSFQILRVCCPISENTFKIAESLLFSNFEMTRTLSNARALGRSNRWRTHVTCARVHTSKTFYQNSRVYARIFWARFWKINARRARTSSAKFESYVKLLSSFDKITIDLLIFYHCFMILFYFILIRARVSWETEIGFDVCSKEDNICSQKNRSKRIHFCKAIGYSPNQSGMSFKHRCKF